MLLARPFCDPSSIQRSVRANLDGVLHGYPWAHPSMLICQAWAGDRVWGRMLPPSWNMKQLRLGETHRESIDLRAGIFFLVESGFSNFLSWGFFHIKCLCVNQMSKKDQCAFACGPSVWIKAQGWRQMQLPLHRLLGRSWLRKAAWALPTPPPLPRVRTGTADGCGGEQWAQKSFHPATLITANDGPCLCPESLGCPGLAGDCGATAALEECGLLFFRTFCQNYLVVTPRGAFGSDPLSMGQVADPMQPHWAEWWVLE